MTKKTERGIVYTTAAVCAAALIFFEYAPLTYAADETMSGIIKMVITRGIGSVMFTVLMLYLGYRVRAPFGKGFMRSLLFALPCFAVVINNLPIIALITGNARVTGSPAAVALFALECIFIGIFEETAFRGCIYLMLLENRRSTVRQIFWVTVLSSAIFGGIHLFNLLAGAGIGPVIQQVGYSFLIGGMCSVVLLRTHNIWLCAALHAIFDFCGFLLPTLGEGSWWDLPTVIITVVLAIAVTLYMTVALLKIDPRGLDAIFPAKDAETKAIEQ